MDVHLSKGNLAEIERSAEEARKLVLTTQQPAHLDRYLHRSESSPFPPEYSFYLLGDVRSKTVLDLGCGSGEIALVRHGANVIGIDISPELVELAAKRLDATGTEATLKVGSAYETGLHDGSIDVIFCMSLIHHLDTDKVSGEMLRVLAPTGYSEHSRISDFEHPLTQGELATIMEPFTAEGLRYFRLPIVPMTIRWLPAGNEGAWKLSAWALRKPAAHQSLRNLDRDEAAEACL